MKRTLLILLAFISFGIVSAQVVFNQVDDFEDGSKQNWFENGTPGETIENISTGGPAGANDNYLRDFTTMSPGGPGARMVIRNNTQWVGDFTTAGVESITLDVLALNFDATIRVSVTGAGGKFSSATGVLVTAGSGWNQIVIPIGSSDMVSVSNGNDGGAAGTDVIATLSGVTEFRLVNSTSPSWQGTVTDGEVFYDNITATAALSTSEFQAQNKEFVISPNPAKNKLNITLPSSNREARLEVFDVLGKRVYKGAITNLNSSVNVSNWRSGVYLVRVSNNNSTQTKRFIKQ